MVYRIISVFMIFSVMSLFCLSAQETKEQRKVNGFADLHIHQMAEYAYGGGWLYGSHSGTAQQALSCCSGMNDHGFLVGEGFFGIHLFRTYGYPTFDGWPAWDSISHQQVYAEWLRDAHTKGLNLMVMSAVNFEYLGEIIPEKHRVKEWGTKDIPAIKRQINAAWKFTQDYPWCEIALTPWDARRIIHEGKLAIVLAIETSDPFGDEELSKQLDEYFDMGVRSFQPVHQLNNRFCGAAPHHMVFYIFQFIRDLTKDKWKARERLFEELQKIYEVDSRSQLPANVKKAADAFWERTFGFEQDKNGKNILGLTDEGRTLLDKMMEKHMLIDVAHMSERSVRETYEIVKKNSYYPIYLSHGHVRAVMLPEKAQEEKTTPLEFMPYIMETGGMFGLRMGIEPTLSYKNSGVENNCPGTNRSFAQMYQFAVKELKLHVAFASDLNGFITQMKPRFGKHHEKYKDELNCPDRGKKKEKGVGTDFDTKGFAHIGLIKDLMTDLNNLGVNTDALDKSAENFILMWERTYDENRKKVSYDVDLEKVKSTIIPHSAK